MSWTTRVPVIRRMWWCVCGGGGIEAELVELGYLSASNQEGDWGGAGRCGCGCGCGGRRGQTGGGGCREGGSWGAEGERGLERGREMGGYSC